MVTQKHLLSYVNCEKAFNFCLKCRSCTHKRFFLSSGKEIISFYSNELSAVCIEGLLIFEKDIRIFYS